MNQSYLLDKEFLAKLDAERHKEIFAKIISLTIDGDPIDTIEGRVTTGSINIDGNAAIRRTCSLTLVSQNLDINDFYWGLKTKFKLEIGVSNNINSQYPDICWFPQGIYVVSQFTTNRNASSYTISVQGQDKMSLLNGTLGGQLPASIDFGQEEYLSYTYRQHIFKSKREFVTGKYYYIDPDNEYEKYEGVFNEEQEYYTYDSTDLEQPYKPITEDGFITGKTYYVKHYTLAMDEFNPNFIYYDQEITSTLTSIPLYTIIREAVHAWANEPYHNIIINDLNTYGLEQLQYKGDKTLYALRPVNSSIYEQMSLNENKRCQRVPDGLKNSLTSEGYLMPNGENPTTTTLSEEVAKEDFVSEKGTDGIAAAAINDLSWITFQAWYDPVSDQEVFDPEETYFIFDNDNQIYIEQQHMTEFVQDTIYYKRNKRIRPYVVLPLEYGDDCGYRLTDLVYAGELVSSIGDTITSILDKIKNMLGDYEYFYNIDGQFVFQRKRTFINTTWNSIEEIEGDRVITPTELASPNTYNFVDNYLISAFNNAPDIKNVRNDFSVWGVRKSISGADIPVHVRYAIDKKPCYYKTFTGNVYTTDEVYLRQAYEEAYTQIHEVTSQRILDFAMKHPDLPPGLQPPTRYANGDWSPGWWDIRDWHDFYVLLTSREPMGTMKWYAHNDENGCVPIKSLIVEDNYNDLKHYQNSIASCWLVIVTKLANGTYHYNFQHGSGQFNANYPSMRTYFESYYSNETTAPVQHGRYTTRLLLTDERYAETGYKYLYTTEYRDENDQPIQQNFYAPYSGCSDDHTYPTFIESDLYRNNARVYFYNPNFPMATYTELTEEMIERTWEEYLAETDFRLVDWREIIYQMALDYFKYGKADTEDKSSHLPVQDVFLQRVRDNNPLWYPSGYTGYEKYYTDLQGFWRQLYDPNAKPIITYTEGQYQDTKQSIDEELGTYYVDTAWNGIKIKNVRCDYYMEGEYDNETEELIGGPSYSLIMEEYDPSDTSYHPQYDTSVNSAKLKDQYINSLVKPDNLFRYWNKSVFNAPETLNFWFDFLDDTSELQAISVPMMGDRTKVVNDNKVTSVYFKQIPDFVFTTKKALDSFHWKNYNRDQMLDKSGYTFLYISQGMEQLFSISYRGKSAKDKIDDLVYQFGYCAENVTINAVPVYYLEPNTRIFVQDSESGVNGEYIVTKITIPLTYNGTMSITANKAPERVY